MKLIRQIVVVMIHIFSQDDSYNQAAFPLFYSARGGVNTRERLNSILRAK